MSLFLADLNGLDLWATDIGNAYLDARTKDKVYIIAGSGVGDKEGHVMNIHKALYGTRFSGIRWHDMLANCLKIRGSIHVE